MSLPTKPLPALLYHALEGIPHLLFALQGVSYPQLAQAICEQARGVFEGLSVELVCEGGLYWLKVSRAVERRAS